MLKLKKILKATSDIASLSKGLEIVKKYVEEPNDADERIDALEIEVHKLKRFSHEPKEFICMECGCKAKKVTKKRKRRK